MAPTHDRLRSVCAARSWRSRALAGKASCEVACAEKMPRGVHDSVPFAVSVLGFTLC